MYKIWLPKVNSEWGIVVNPVADNTYKHIINFPNVELRNEFINNKFFEGREALTVLNEEGIEIQLSTLTSNKSIVTLLYEDYPEITIQEFLNADYIPVLNFEEQTILWYQINGSSKSGKQIIYNCELDIFFNYWHLISIPEKVEIMTGHIDRKENGEWVQDSNSPLYNDNFQEGKKIIKEFFSINRKKIGDNKIYDQMEDSGVDFGGIYLFRSPTPDTGVTNDWLNIHLDNTTRFVQSGILAYYVPLGYQIMYNGNLVNENVFFAKWLNATYVTFMIYSNYNPVDLNDNRGAAIWDNDSKILRVDNTSGAEDIEFWGGVYWEGEKQFLIRDWFITKLREQNIYEVDLTAFGPTGNKVTEISAFQNGLNDIVIGIGPELKYTIPHKFLGKIVNFELIANLEGSTFSEHFKLLNFYENENINEGLNSENLNYLTFSNDKSEEYKLQNKGNILGRKISISLELIGGALLGITGHPAAAFASETKGISNYNSLKDINRIPNQQSGTGYTTYIDFAILPNKLKYYCRWEVEYGNKVVPLTQMYYLYGNSINQLLPFDSFLNTRETFNYIQAEGIFNKIKTPRLSSENKQLISNSFANGLTLWHYRGADSWGGILNYETANNEVILLKKKIEK